MDSQRAWLIDASIYIFRAWFSMPDRWHTDSGQPVQAVYGYSQFLLDFIDKTGDAFYGAAAFDESLGSNYRNDIYPAYKSSRELPDEPLAFQLHACRQISEKLGIPCYGGSRYEADDYLASVAQHFQERDVPVTVVTRDKDLGQIIKGPQDNWWDFAQGVTLDAAAFEDKFGVKPGQFADYLALVGDPIDDIPGVPGVGAKTAARLLHSYGSLDGLAKGLGTVGQLDIRGAAGLQRRLQEHWAQVLLARQLTGLETGIAEVTGAPFFQLSVGGIEDVVDYLGELNLAGPLTRRWQRLARELPPT
jgi:5'-3' exonuclease